MVQFLDPETTEILPFLDPEIVKMDKKNSGSRNCRNGAISGSRNRRKGRQILYADICYTIENEVGADAIDQVNRIDEDLVIKALGMMQNNKNDSIFAFQSDCLIHSPPELVSYLVKLLKLFIIHGEVPCILLVWK